MISEAFQDYLLSCISPEPELLKKLNRETHVTIIRSRMLSGHQQGLFLRMISFMIAPDRILEIGTFTGYSALCMADGLRENGKLYTIEINEEVLDLARTYFKASPNDAKIISLHGDALEIIDSIDEIFDLIFIDADKKRNFLYYEKCIEKLRPGGFMLIDNVLWDGKVFTGHTDADTLLIKELNTFITTDQRVENLIIPLRDGLHLIRKK